MKKPYKIVDKGGYCEVVGDFDAYYKDHWSDKIKPDENSAIFRPEDKSFIKVDWKSYFENLNLEDAFGLDDIEDELDDDVDE